MGRQAVLVGALASTASLAHASLSSCSTRSASTSKIQELRCLSPLKIDQQPDVDVCSSSYGITTLRGGASHSSSSSNDDPAASNVPKTSKKKPRKRRTSKEEASASAPKNVKSSAVVDEIVKEEDYYKILGTTKEEVNKAAKPDTVIQKAYRRRAVQTHPDKTGGDRRAFDKVAEAYDALQDSEKRKLYDRYGKQGTASAGGAGGMSGMGSEDLFRSFFGGGSASPFASSGYQQQRQRNRTMRFQLEVTLEDLYRGTSKTVQLPGHKNVHVTIPRGAFHNQQIVASGAMDSDADHPPSDALFWLKQRPHSVFTRKGHDLAVELQISLAEAVTGVQRKIRHLDGRVLHVVSAPVHGSRGSTSSSSDGPAVIATGDMHVLKGEGMPKDAAGAEFGDLYIQYQVKMPTKCDGELTETERHELKRLLNKLEGHTKGTLPDWPFASKDAKVLQKASSSDFGRSSGQSNESFESFDESGFSPFGQRRFYWSSSASSNPFFGQHGPQMFGDDDGDAQCRQM